MTAATAPQCGDIWRERRGARGTLPPRYVMVTCVLRESVEIRTAEFIEGRDGGWRFRRGSAHRIARRDRFDGRGSGYELHLAAPVSATRQFNEGAT